VTFVYQFIYVFSEFRGLPQYFFNVAFFLPYVLFLCISTAFVFYLCLCAGIILGIGAVKPER